jgi:hypothetical protein
LAKLKAQIAPPPPVEFDSEPLFVEPEPEPDVETWRYASRKPQEDPLLTQARAYEEAGDLKRAIKAYRKATRKAKTAVDSYRAERLLIDTRKTIPAVPHQRNIVENPSYPAQYRSGVGLWAAAFYPRRL